MNELFQYFTVIFLSSFEIYVAIASGLAFGMSSHEICITTLIGGISGVFISAFLGDKVSALLSKFRKPKEKSETATSKLLKNLWDKYGKVGVGFIGTLLIGAPASIAVGVGFGVKAKELVTFSLAGVVLRCIAYSYFFTYIKDLF